jgi:hypothetical protein
MKLKIGYKIKFKSLDWFKKTCNSEGIIDTEFIIFDKDMTILCGRIYEIKYIRKIDKTELFSIDHICFNGGDNNYWFIEEFIEKVITNSQLELDL